MGLIVAFAEREQCAARRKADFSCRLSRAVSTTTACEPVHFRDAGMRPLTATDECEHR